MKKRYNYTIILFDHYCNDLTDEIMLESCSLKEAIVEIKEKYILNAICLNAVRIGIYKYDYFYSKQQNIDYYEFDFQQWFKPTKDLNIIE